MTLRPTAPTAWASPRAPSTRASRTRPPGAVMTPSTPPRPTPRRARACTRASSTPRATTHALGLRACVADLESGTAGFRLRLGHGRDPLPCLELLTLRRPLCWRWTTSTRHLPPVRAGAAALGGTETSATWTCADPAAIEAAIRPNTRMIWVETPTNPTLRWWTSSRSGDRASARDHHVADNTFASPGSSGPWS
jgi:hypothetical protein